MQYEEVNVTSFENIGFWASLFCRIPFSLSLASRWMMLFEQAIEISNCFPLLIAKENVQIHKNCP